MSMKQVFESALNGNFDLSAMLDKINTHHIAGNLSDTEREELIRKARAKADPMGGLDVTAKLTELEDRIRAVEETIKTSGSTESESTETADVADYQIGKWYKAGDLMRYTDGHVYRCVYELGYIRAWSPETHPDSWELVE